MGTEQDGKEAFSNKSSGSETTGHMASERSVIMRTVTTPEYRFESLFNDSQRVPLLCQSPTVAAPAMQQTTVNMNEVPEPTQQSVKSEVMTTPGKQVIVIQRDSDGEIEILHDDNVSFEKGEEKLLTKIIKTAAVRPLRSDKDATCATLDKEILQYVVKYEDEEVARKITMRDLRHVIPLLIMRCYNVTEEPYHRKVRGMWTEKPQNWPENIPYCDPNNKKDAGKPKKETLLQMFMHLKRVYTENHGSVVKTFKSNQAQSATISTPAASQTRSSGPILTSAEAMETVTTTMAAQPTTQPSPPSDYLARAPHLSPAFVPSGTTSVAAPPPALPDSVMTSGAVVESAASAPATTGLSHINIQPLMENFTWDPEVDLLDRVEKKLEWLSRFQQLPHNQMDTLQHVLSVLHNMFQVRSQDHVFFLEIAHEFEATLDAVRTLGKCEEKHLKRWANFCDNERNVPDPAASEQVQVLVTDAEACQPLLLGREEEVIDEGIIISTTRAPKDAEVEVYGSSPPTILTTTDGETASLQMVDRQSEACMQMECSSEESGRKGPGPQSELPLLISDSLGLIEDRGLDCSESQPFINLGCLADIDPMLSIESLLLQDPCTTAPQSPLPNTTIISSPQSNADDTGHVSSPVQEQSVNLSKLKNTSHNEEEEKEDDANRLRRMASAVYKLQKEKEGAVDTRIKSATANMIPTFVQEMDGQSTDEEPEPKKRKKNLKRQHPRTRLTIFP